MICEITTDIGGSTKSEIINSRAMTLANISGDLQPMIDGRKTMAACWQEARKTMVVM